MAIKWLLKLMGKAPEAVHSQMQEASFRLLPTFCGPVVNEQSMHDLENDLLASDIGHTISSNIMQTLMATKRGQKMGKQEMADFLLHHFLETLNSYTGKLQIDRKPHCIMLCGVNGSGKTSAAGKIAHLLQQRQYRVIMAACDTYRAAAAEQLQVWGAQLNCPVVAGVAGADPASVAHRALQQAISDDADVLLIDTAGRLNNQTNLMAELAKIVKVVQKLDTQAPQQILMTIDATSGRHVLQQVADFMQAVPINGLLVTKLDGTARGGVLLEVVTRFRLPVFFMSAGEGRDDLVEFHPTAFLHRLLGAATT